MKPETRTIRVRSFDAYVEVQAAVWGGVLALYRLSPDADKWGWTVTHVPTGATVYNPQLQREGKGFILAALAAGQSWDWRNLTRENMEVLRELIMRQPAAAPPPTRSLGDLCVDWLPGFTPSEELQALARAVNRSWHSEDHALFATSTAAFTAREWREVIVARMATGKRGTLLPGDVRGGAQSINGIPCGIAECKRRFRISWEIGTKIDEVAGKMAGLIAVGDPAGTDEDQWVALDDELRGLIIEGWGNWAGQVHVFSQLPLEDQAPFLKRLGFLGSKEKGWQALGVKTFLRSPGLRNILPTRREIKRRIGNYGEE